MASSLLLEIGCEEIPAGFIAPALEFMAKRLGERFDAIGLKHDAAEIFGTPRRLTVRFNDLAERLDDTVETKLGPAKAAAFDAAGQPTKAALGFCRGAGVDIKDVEFRPTDKGEYLCVEKTIPGGTTAEMLPAILTETILQIPFRKTMRWSNAGVRFARPVHWLVALFGEQVLPVSFGDIQAGKLTYGNRFMSKGALTIAEPANYEAVLEDEYVIPSIDKRKARIMEGLKQAAAEVEAEIRDIDLLDEVAGLIEYPYVIRGNFDPSFLKMPAEVLVTVMLHHQRYFPLYDPAGKLKPSFLAVSGIIPNNDDVVRAGNEKVLRARLADGQYFYEEDLNVPLADFAARHQQVIFHKDLGTSWAKIERFKALALYLADFLAIDKKDKVGLAAELCKADLNSQMVYEFPELQGIMGREYALAQGIDHEVAVAIHEHYLPANAEDRLPANCVADIVGIADRLDTICGCFAIGQTPTGNSDPYALRRQAIAIENILVGKGYRVSINEMVDQALSLLAPKLKRPGSVVQAEIIDFFRSRFVSILQAKGFSGDVIEAVIGDFNDPLDTLSRATALAGVREEAWFASICAASKRVENILKKAEAAGAIKPELFETEPEKTLYACYQEIEQPFIAAAAKGDYHEALKLLVSLSQPIDSFFDGVMVMCEDQAVRANRLSLLKSLVNLFGRIARFASLAV